MQRACGAQHGLPTHAAHAACRRADTDAAWDAAREHGLPAITLRDVAARVGMQAPSLHSYFDSKAAIYDAMFGQAWSAWREIDEQLVDQLPASPRAALKVGAQAFFDFCVADPPRHQLMNLRLIPDSRRVHRRTLPQSMLSSASVRNYAVSG
jgi:AcrR family transcriptional regulator